VRRLLGLDTEGQVFRDRFLIADIRMRSHFPTERWFWFDPPFHPGQSVLLHRQADDVWRVDFQLGPDADPEEEKRPERIAPRLRAMLGPDVRFELEWASVYTFQCRRMQRFRHGRVIFAGDAAHLVSPFGARGANSGMQDADNLVWKLDLVLRGQAPERLLDTYDIERSAAADENILHSTRATDFISPKTAVSRLFRDAVLQLARDYPFARRLVNSGRLSVPAVLRDSPLNTPDGQDVAGGGDGQAFATDAPPPGAAAVDAPVNGPLGPWLLDHLGSQFTLLSFGGIAADAVPRLASASVACAVIVVDAGADAGSGASGLPPSLVVRDRDGRLARRYDARPGTGYLFRPDQHVCARWRAFDGAAVAAAIARATCNG
jgi:3-(3-hydroxy-phenyl)propionate hydroxylase